MSKIFWMLGCVGVIGAPVWVQASQSGASPTITRDFEDTKALAFQMMPGKASNGSTIESSTEKAHSGKSAVKVHYQFAGSGYLQFLTPSTIALPPATNVTLGVWVHGDGLGALDSTTVRFVDAKNETFQYNLGAAMTRALGGDSWQRVQIELDLTKPNGHWGDNSDGVPDLPLKFLGFAMSTSATEPAAGSVYLDDLEFKTHAAVPTVTAPQAGTATLSLQPVWTQPTPAIFIYAPGTPVIVKANLTAASGSATSDTATLSWTARDFENNLVATGKAPLQGQKAQWTLPAGKPGIWYVNAEVRDDSGTLLAQNNTRVAFAAAAKTLTPPQPLLWGVNSHPEHCTPEEVEREAALTKALGFTTIRGGAANWLSVQPDNNQQWNWEKGDRIFDAYNRYGLNVILGFLGTPKWASRGNTGTTDWRDWAYVAPKNLGDLTNYLKAVSKRYNQHVAAYEVWNEPDIAFWRGTPDEYTQLWDASYKAIKSVVPNAKVMNGGFSETKRQPDFIPHFARTATEKPDIFAYHTHQQFSNLVRAGDDVKGYLQNAKWMGTPVWLNEAGFSSSGNLTERDQASALIKKYSYSAALGYEAYFWYDLRNDGTDPSELEHNFGLVRRDFIPKASAVAARTLTARLGGKRFVRRLEAPAGVYALLFEGKNAAGSAETTAVVWNEASNGAEVPLFWKVSGQVTTTSAMGSAASVPVRGGVAITNAAPMPRFVTMTGAATSVSLAPQVLRFDGAILAAPGSSENWKLTLTNPLAEVWKGQIKLNAQDGWKTKPQTLAFSVPARGKSDFTIPVSAPANAPMSSLKVELTSPNLPTPVTAVARLLPAIEVPGMASRGTAGDFSHWKAPTVQLGSSHIVSLFEATPMQDLHFHGDTDLSAKVYLAKVPEGLLLGVRVRDDVHTQNETPGMEWQGDSVQFALSLPSGTTYEWAASLAPTGPRVTLFGAPSGVPTGPTNLPVSIQREGDETRYEMLISKALPGSSTPLPNRIRFSLLVNDNDGGGRKGWIEWTPGIGRTKDPSQYQPLVLR